MEHLSLDELSLQQLSEKKTNNVSIFREKPPLELVNIVLKFMGFDNGLMDTRTFTKDDLRDESIDEWLPLLEPYYLPCKAKRFLEFLTKDKFVTIIRHILRVHNFDLRTQERIICGVKRTQYRIEPQTPSFTSKSGILIEFN
jgi:hypothetical protein